MGPESHQRVDEGVSSSSLVHSPTTSSIVLELTREAVSNAIRHGDAGRIEISVTADPLHQDIHLRVTNDGQLLPDDLVEGVGTRLLEDMTLEWTRANDNRHVTVFAVALLETEALTHSA